MFLTGFLEGEKGSNLISVQEKQAITNKPKAVEDHLQPPFIIPGGHGSRTTAQPRPDPGLRHYTTRRVVVTFCARYARRFRDHAGPGGRSSRPGSLGGLEVKDSVGLLLTPRRTRLLRVRVPLHPVTHCSPAPLRTGLADFPYIRLLGLSFR